ESPSHYVIEPLLSRLSVYRFKKLSNDDVKLILKRALRTIKKELSDEEIETIVLYSDGDARKALVSLQNLIEGGETQKREILDRKQHYDLISAFIKSVRGSDPDAAIYYLARMLELGEDPRFIARRLIILASEDVGLADPMALPIATAAAQAVELVGLPEAEINLAHATIYLSLAPKSNSAYKALRRAKEVSSLPAEVPHHLKNLPNSGYKYPHDFGGWVEQRYLPENIEGPFYIPTDQDPKNWKDEK
ncbi:MAG: replication-associated recombination protein A, partial [Thermotogaceae bacterium]|nr:replication-associated recombination protein A [Thermotogaceae bacterium]